MSSKKYRYSDRHVRRLVASEKAFAFGEVHEEFMQYLNSCKDESTPKQNESTLDENSQDIFNLIPNEDQDILGTEETNYLHPSDKKVTDIEISDGNYSLQQPDILTLHSEIEESDEDYSFDLWSLLEEIDDLNIQNESESDVSDCEESNIQLSSDEEKEFVIYR